jgi:hypothetical protein
MVYNNISSKVCIARGFDRFNIDYSGFVGRVPSWIFSAMYELDLYLALKNETVTGTVVDYKCAIPPQTKILEGVGYEGFRLYRLGGINEQNSTNMANLMSLNYKYELADGYIITTFETGTVTFYIKSLPVELDSNLKLYFPLVPNDENVLNALDWYILKRLLERNHSIVPYSLKENNEFTNPAIAWEKAKKIARNSIITIDNDERHHMSMMIRSFIQDYDYYNSTGFNPNSIIIV